MPIIARNNNNQIENVYIYIEYSNNHSVKIQYRRTTPFSDLVSATTNSMKHVDDDVSIFYWPFPHFSSLN